MPYQMNRSVMLSSVPGLAEHLLTALAITSVGLDIVVLHHMHFKGVLVG